MPPIHLTHAERAALIDLAKAPTPISDLSPICVPTLLAHGLVARDCLCYRITAKGQLELFRQRYRNMATRRKTKLSRADLQPWRAPDHTNTGDDDPALAWNGDTE